MSFFTDAIAVLAEKVGGPEARQSFRELEHTVNQTIDVTVSSAKENPGALATGVIGGVLVATGIGAPVGAALIAKGAGEIALDANKPAAPPPPPAPAKTPKGAVQPPNVGTSAPPPPPVPKGFVAEILDELEDLFGDLFK